MKSKLVLPVVAVLSLVAAVSNALPGFGMQSASSVKAQYRHQLPITRETPAASSPRDHRSAADAYRWRPLVQTGGSQASSGLGAFPGERTDARFAPGFMPYASKRSAVAVLPREKTIGYTASNFPQALSDVRRYVAPVQPATRSAYRFRPVSGHSDDYEHAVAVAPQVYRPRPVSGNARWQGSLSQYRYQYRQQVETKSSRPSGYRFVAKQPVPAVLSEYRFRPRKTRSDTQYRTTPYAMPDVVTAVASTPALQRDKVAGLLVDGGGAFSADAQYFYENAGNTEYWR